MQKNRTKIRGGVLEKIKQSGLYKIHHLFNADVLKGFEDYKKIVNKYGKDVVIFSTAWRGTGDYFICGLYLQEYLRVNNIENYVFLIPKNGGERKVVELFQVYDSHIMEAENATALITCNAVLPEKRLLHYLHHGFYNVKNPCINLSNTVRSGWVLNGYNGLHMVDFYLNCGFKLPENAHKSTPRFLRDRKIINEWFEKNDLIKGKTVLMAPYSTGLKQYEIPEEFWIKLVLELDEKGYTTVTNCVGSERCISGTKALNIPYNQIVSFLEEAGYFIGIRSGLCDVIAGAACKKVIIHTYKAKWWRDGESISYTGLNNMGFCNDAVEFEYRNGEDIAELLNYALNYIKQVEAP